MHTISSLRRRADRLGYRVVKSNWRRDSIDNHGGYMIVDNATNGCAYGDRYDLELEAVADFLDQIEKEAA